MANTGLPSLSIPVKQGQSLYDISRIYGAGAGFGGADYIAALQAGYTDSDIVNFLNANPYLNTGAAKDLITQGKQADLIAAGTPNIGASDANRLPLLANPCLLYTSDAADE